MIVSWLNRAGTVSLRGLVAFGKFWYGFIIGDDWTVAAAVAAAHRGRGRVVAAAAGRGGRDRGQPSPHGLALDQGSVCLRTVTPRPVRIIQNFFLNDPWYHLLAPEALSRYS
jgi:hypothetical protein